MRFDDPQYVEDWQTGGGFPKIHAHIASAVLKYTKSNEGCLDLGACTGLLSRQLLDAGRRVVAVEPSTRAVMTGRPVYLDPEHEITLLQLPVKLHAQSFHEITAAIRQQNLTTVVARRVFPEISDANTVEDVGHIAAAFVSAGIRRFVLEGRLDSTSAVHPLKNVQLEADAVTRLFAPSWRRSVSADLPNIIVLEQP